MFNVGDEVVFIADDPYKWYKIGDCVTVTELLDRGHTVRIKDSTGKECHWDIGYFVLASEYSAAQQLTETARYLPDETEVRKDYPLFDGLFGYFPNALCEVARWSKHSNQQHNPGEPMHWAKDKSTDHKNKIMRHTLDAEQLNKDGFYEAIGAAWRALALAEEILVASGKPWGANVK